MKKVSVNLALDPEEINHKLEKVRELKNLFLLWLIEGFSMEKYPHDIITILRDYDSIDKHFLLLTRKIDNVKSREKGEEICYPEIE